MYPAPVSDIVAVTVQEVLGDMMGGGQAVLCQG